MRLAPQPVLALASLAPVFVMAPAVAQAEPQAQVAAPVTGAPAATAPAADTHAATTSTEAARRAGLVLGLMGGFGVAGASGYPNSASKIDDPSYYSSSDLLRGSGGSFFLMG